MWISAKNNDGSGLEERVENRWINQTRELMSGLFENTWI